MNGQEKSERLILQKEICSAMLAFYQVRQQKLKLYNGFVYFANS